MTPRLNGIDHVHIYVANWGEAEKWYQTVFGFRRVDALMDWAVKNGPLTIENPEGNIHLALFEKESHPNTSAIAFGASGEENVAMRPASAMGNPARHRSLMACGPLRSMTSCTCPIARVTGPIKASLCFLSGTRPAAAASRA